MRPSDMQCLPAKLGAVVFLFCGQAMGAADIFLEIITQPFLGFDDIVPGSSNQVTVPVVYL